MQKGDRHGIHKKKCKHLQTREQWSYNKSVKSPVTTQTLKQKASSLEKLTGERLQSMQEPGEKVKRKIPDWYPYISMAI